MCGVVCVWGWWGEGAIVRRLGVAGFSIFPQVLCDGESRCGMRVGGRCL